MSILDWKNYKRTALIKLYFGIVMMDEIRYRFRILYQSKLKNEICNYNVWWNVLINLFVELIYRKIGSIDQSGFKNKVTNSIYFFIGFFVHLSFITDISKLVNIRC